MSKALITEGYLTDIANAIRAKNGSADTYTPPQMAAAIADIPTGSDVDVEELNVTENGTTVAPSGKAYSPVNVNVPNTYTAADEGKVVDNGALVAQTSRTVTANGTYDTTVNDSVTVNVPGGGGGAFAYAICHGTSGTTVVATDGTTTLNGTISGGRLFLEIPNSGTWTFTNDGVTVQKSITTQGEVVDVSFIFVIHQDNTPAGATFTYANEGKEMIVLWPYSDNHEGIVFDTIGHEAIRVLHASQAGVCTDTATLPDITDKGTGRVRYAISFPYDFTKSSTQRFFAVFYNKTIGSTVSLVIEVTD